MQNLIATTFEVVHYIALQAVHYKPLQEVHLSRYNQSYTLSSHGGREQRFYIPERVLDYFNDEFDYREVANSSELTDMAVAIFVGMLDTPAVSAGGGGGGSQSDLPWRDKDDDDLQWARRCARAATLLLGKKPRTGLRR